MGKSHIVVLLEGVSRQSDSLSSPGRPGYGLSSQELTRSFAPTSSPCSSCGHAMLHANAALVVALDDTVVVDGAADLTATIPRG